MKKIVIYDVDYTIISINSLISFIIYLLKLNLGKILLFPFLFFAIILWIFRIISTEMVKTIWLMPIKGMRIKQLEEFSKDFTNRYLIPKLKKEAVENINNYKKNGFLVILASASFEIYIKYLAEYLKADYYFGTRILVKNNIVTSEINGKNCRGKEKIKRILKEISKDLIIKENSVAFSDSKSDLPFLEIVNKFCLISKKKWKILKTFYN